MSGDETPVEVDDPHAGCPSPVWNGHTFECRNHNPYVELPRVRKSAKGQQPAPAPAAAVQSRGPFARSARGRRPQQPATGVPEAVLDAVAELQLEVQGLAGEYHLMSDRVRNLTEAIEPLLKLDARLAGLEEQSKLYFAHVQDNIAHVQRLAGRLMKLEQWANGGDVPEVVQSLTPPPEEKTDLKTRTPAAKAAKAAKASKKP